MDKEINDLNKEQLKALVSLNFNELWAEPEEKSNLLNYFIIGLLIINIIVNFIK